VLAVLGELPAGIPAPETQHTNYFELEELLAVGVKLIRCYGFLLEMLLKAMSLREPKNPAI